MIRVFLPLLCALAAGCASGAARPPVTEPGAPTPTSAPSPGADGPASPTPPATPDDRSEDLDTEAEAVGIRRLGRWSHSGIETGERLVIRDQGALSAFSTRAALEEELPAVDFGRELVIAVAAGQQSSGGHSISLGRAVLRDGVLSLEVVRTSPSPDCITTQALTQPLDLVAVPADGVERWRFVEREEVGGCGG